MQSWPGGAQSLVGERQLNRFRVQGADAAHRRGIYHSWKVKSQESPPPPAPRVRPREWAGARQERRRWGGAQKEEGCCGGQPHSLSGCVTNFLPHLLPPSPLLPAFLQLRGNVPSVESPFSVKSQHFIWAPPGWFEKVLLSLNSRGLYLPRQKQ